jgi:hypothetical protein
MKKLRFALLAAVLVGCHFDKLFTTTGGGRAPPVGSSPTLAFTTQPTNTTAGAPLPTIRVSAEDGAGHTQASFGGPVTVALAGNPGAGTLAGTVTVAAVNGVATFPDLRIDKAASGYTLAAAASGLTGDQSTAFTVNPGPASVLVFTVQPHNTVPLATIQPPVQVTAFDAFGNQASDFAGTVRIALGHNGSLGGSATLSGTTTQSAVKGVATFSDLSINQSSVTYYTLTAAFGTGTPVVESASFTEP